MTRLILILSILIISCRQTTKFNKDGWLKKSDLGLYPEREKMLIDLTKNHKLKGLHYNDIIKMLGQPDFLEPENRIIFYSLTTNYGADIDPTRQRSLKFQLTLDSIISDFAIIDSGQ